MIKFLGIKFDLLSKEDLLREHDSLMFVVTANAEIIIKAIEESSYKNILSKAHCTFDGQIPFILAKIKNPGIAIEKLSGSDLIYDIGAKADKNKEKIFLLGGLEESNTRAEARLKILYPGAMISGYSPIFSPYPFQNDLSEDIKNKIKEFQPDYIFVGFGAGKQEQWICDNYQFLEDLKVKIAIGSGGTFEFVSGKIKRAPRILQKIGLEGVFRLMAQPQWFRLKRILRSFKIFYYFAVSYTAMSSLFDAES